MKNTKSNQKHYSVRKISALKIFGVGFACIFAILVFEFLGLIAATLWDAIIATAEQHFNTVFTLANVSIIFAIVMLVAGFIVLVNRIAVIECENRRKKQIEEDILQEQHRQRQQHAQQPRRPVNQHTFFDQDAQPGGFNVVQHQRPASPARKEEIHVLPAALERRAQ